MQNNTLKSNQNINDLVVQCKLLIKHIPYITTTITIIFAGKNYWQYSEDVTEDQWLREGGFPTAIAEDFPGLPKSVTAAVYDRFTRKTYFIKGAYLWRYDELQQQFDLEKERVDTVFEGLPSKLSGAFQDVNGKVLFRDLNWPL